jgi:hypothetical protein
MALGLVLSLVAPTSAQPASDAVAVVKKVYEASDPVRAKVYSKRLQALLDKDAKQAKGEVGNLEFDFAVNGQDTEAGYRKTLRFEPGPATSGGAAVTVTFRNFEPQNLRYDLVRENGRWVVDEVRSLGRTKWVLSSLLKGGRR